MDQKSLGGFSMTETTNQIQEVIKFSKFEIKQACSVSWNVYGYGKPVQITMISYQYVIAIDGIIYTQKDSFKEAVEWL